MVVQKRTNQKKIASILGIRLEERIFARKTEIKRIGVETKKVFLEENHIQGNCQTIINLGAFFGEELVGVMTFSKPRGDNEENNWDLSRFATSKNVIGLGSKMLSFFIKNWHPKTIISFSDNRWSTGDLYKKMGFSFVNQTQPSYWYTTRKGERLHKSNFKKDLLKKKFENYEEEKTEYETMLLNGYDRIWDCGLIKWRFVC